MPVRPLGATVRAWRRYRQLSLTALASRAGLGAAGRGYVSKIEHGSIREPGDVLLERLAQALEVPLSYLLLHQLPERADADGPSDLGPDQVKDPLADDVGAARQLARSIEHLDRKVDRLIGLLAGMELDRQVRDYERALAEMQVDLASSHFQAAITLLETLADSPPHRLQRLALLARHGQVANLLMQFPEYYGLLTRFEPEARELDQPALLAALLANKAWSEWALGSFGESIASATEAAALGRAANNPSVTGQAYVAQLWSHVYLGDLSRAVELEQAVFGERAKQFEYLWHFFAAAGSALALTWLGRWDAALREIDRAQPVAQEFADRSMDSFANWIRCLIHTYRGDLAGAVAAGTKALGSAATPVDRLWAEGHLACARIRAGALDQGIPRLAESLATLRAARFIGGEHWALFLAEGYRRAGDLARAEQTLEEHLVIVERCGMRFCLGSAHRLLGDLIYEADPGPATAEAAEVSFEKSIRLLRAIDAQGELGLAYADFGRLLERQGEPERAAEYLTQALEIADRLAAPSEVANT